MKLITVFLSHYCDKARWALDRYAVPYVESPYFPLFHMPAVAWKAGRGSADKASSPFSTPVLVRGEGLEPLRDSAAIVRWVDQTYGGGQLTNVEGAERWERRLHDGLGVWTRALVYGLGLPESARETPTTLGGMALPHWMAEQNLPRRQVWMVRATGPLLRTSLVRLLKLDPSRMPRLRDKVMQELDAIYEEVGANYLVADRFTVADLSLAAMLAPLTLPPEYGVVLPPVARLPKALASLVHGVRAHPLGDFALRLYRDERNRLEAPCSPSKKL